MKRRILHATYATGLDTHPVVREGIVLLRNRGGALPLAASAKSIVVICC